MKIFMPANMNAINAAVFTMFSLIGTIVHGQGNEAIGSNDQSTDILTKRQQKVFLELQDMDGNKAMAIGPRKQWGRAWGRGSVTSATEGALKYCNEFVKVGEALCQIILLNDEVKEVDFVGGRIASERYTAYRYDQAVSFFGVRNFNFKGDREVAKAEYAQIVEDADHLAAMDEDTQLRGHLENSSFLRKNQYAIFLGGDESGQRSKANSGYLEVRALGWKVMNSGLLCLFGRTWVSTGKPLGVGCLFVIDVTEGVATLMWPQDSRNSWISPVLNGDARRSSVR